MIPLRDDVPSQTRPVVTWALIAVNIAVFLCEWSLGDARLERLIDRWGMIPAAYWDGRSSLVAAIATWTFGRNILPIFTAMFLHSGWAHVLGNMLYLYIFGDNVEDRMGHGRFLGFYLCSGVCGALAHLYFNAGEAIPTIGASGAIAGVLGAYLLLYPRARVAVLIFIVFLVDVIWVPAVFVLGAWFLIQFLNGVASIGPEHLAQGGTAWWAHIGGFLCGVALVGVLKRPERVAVGEVRNLPWR